MQFNTSRFNPISLGFQEETIKGQFVLPHSSDIGLGRSQLLANNPTIDLHQNENFSQSHPIVGLGQLSLNQRMTDLRRAYGAPHRVQVHTQIDYFPLQNQQTLPMSEVSVTEVVRTRIFNETSSKENIFVPNDTVNIQDKRSFQNPLGNDLFPKNKSFQGPVYQNLTKNHQALNLGGFSHHNEPRRGDFYPNLSQIRQALNLWGLANRSGPKKDEVISPQPISMYVPKANLNPSGSQIPNHDQLGINFQKVCMNESSSNQTRVSNLINPLRPLNLQEHPSPVRVPSPVVQNDPNDEYDVEDDGRTHSLPTKKYGPYICPKCEGVFYTSQCFASHIGAHYKNESKTERKNRQVARYKKKYLRRFESRKALTILPPSFKMVGRRNTYDKRKGKAASKIKEKEVQKQDQIVPKVAAKRDLPYVGVKIKEEPM